MKRIALLSNVTMTPVAKRVNRATGMDIYQPREPGDWMRELTDLNSDLHQSASRVVFIILHGASLLGDLDPDSLDDAEALLTQAADAISVVSARRPEVTFVASTLDIPNAGPRPLVSHRPELAAAAFWRRALENRNIPILELSEIAANMGRVQFYNNRTWYMSAIPLSSAGEEALALEVERIWRAVRGVRKKCLALDLDNTLWGGVLGEGGMDSLHLDRRGSGARFYDFQRRIRILRGAGVRLVILSKNNPEDARSAIDNHPHMLLREPDFAAIRANWEQKAKNLRAVAQELGVEAKDFVFIDDNPVERDAMRIALPGVAVPEFPVDSAQLVPFIDEVARDYFLELRKNTNG